MLAKHADVNHVGILCIPVKDIMKLVQALVLRHCLQTTSIFAKYHENSSITLGEISWTNCLACVQPIHDKDRVYMDTNISVMRFYPGFDHWTRYDIYVEHRDRIFQLLSV